MLNQLWVKLLEPCSGKGWLEEPDQETLKKPRKWLLVRQEEYTQIIQNIYEIRIVEFVCEDPREIIGLFAMPKDEDEKKRLIREARRENCYCIEQ